MDEFDFSQPETPDKNFHYYLMKAQQAREQMAMGRDAIREDFANKSLKERIKDRLRTWGVGGVDPQSIYSANEQNSLASSDFLSNKIIKSSNLLLGGAQLASSFLPTKGLSSIALWSSMGTGMAGMGGLSSGLGMAATLTNPYALAATLGTKAISFGMQENIIDPIANSRLFQSTINSNLKGVIGGLNSNSGRGGMDLQTSFKLARNIDTIRATNREVSPESINKFLEAGAQMPQMQNIDSDKVAANMEKFVNIMVKLGKQFKGKENDLLQAMQQFSSMGMSLDQADRTLSMTSQLGKNLNIDPNRIMSAGMSTASSLMGTNISQTTGYGLGSKSFIQAEMMKQRGQYSLTQLNNFGGSEGIGQTVANSSMALLNSNLSDVFLKSLYTKDGGINQENLKNLSVGNMGLREAQFRSQNVTLSPETNMKYQFDKQSIISNLGDNAFGVSNQIFNQLATRNPWGNTLQGRAKYAMQLGIAQDMQSARLFAQQNMAYNPMLDAITGDYKMDQQMAGQDPWYSSRTGVGQLSGQLGTALNRGWKSIKRDSVFGYLNYDTQHGKDFMGGFGNMMTLGMGRGLIDYLDKTASNVNIQGFKPFAGINNVDELYDASKSLKNLGTRSKKDIALDEIGRSRLYSNFDNLERGADRDMIRDFSKEITKKYSSELNSITDPEQYRKRQLEIYNEETKNRSELTEGDFILNNGSRVAKNSMQGKNILMGSMPMNYDLTKLSKDSISLEDRKMGSYNTDVTNQTRKGIVGLATMYGSVAAPFLNEAYNFLSGDSKDETRYNMAKDKFNIADIETRKKMMDKLDKTIAESGDESKELGADFEEMFGFSTADKKQLEMIRKPMGEGISMGDLKTKSVFNTIDMIYGSRQAKDTFSKYGNENIGLGIISKFFGKETDKENLKIGEKELSQLRKDFGNDPGLGGIIKNIKLDADGNVDFNQMSEKKKKSLMAGIMAKDGGIFEGNRIMSSPQEVWEHNRFNKATTINDFAVAVTKGVMEANKLSGETGWKNWVNSENTKETK